MASEVKKGKERILNLFRNIEGKKILSGIFGGFVNEGGEHKFGSDQAERIYELAKKYPAVYALDGGRFGETEPGRETDLVEVMHKDAVDYAKKGGLISVSHVLPNPTLPGNKTGSEKRGFEMGLTNEQYEKLLMDGTPERELLYKLYDKVAEGLAGYQSLGITILYRPFEEMNSAFFWWGANFSNSGDEKRFALFKALWKDLFYYFTERKGLQNLIWIYSPVYFARRKKEYYPGSDYVDMVGLDVYLNDFSNIPGYDEMISLGKPFAFTEVGPQHNSKLELIKGKLDYTKMIKTILNDYSKAVYFLPWNYQWCPTKNINGWGAYNNDRVLNLGEFSV